MLPTGKARTRASVTALDTFSPAWRVVRLLDQPISVGGALSTWQVGSLIHRQANCTGFPSILFGSLYDICSFGISFNVSANSMKVIIILNWKTFEPALVDVTITDCSMMSMISLSMSQSDPANKRRHLSIHMR